MSLNDYARECFSLSFNAGWWKDCQSWEVNENDTEVATDPHLLGTKIALIHSETSEMLEGLRKGLMDDHLTERTMEEVECADMLIRIFDYAGARGLDIDGALREKLAYNANRADHKAAARAAEGGKKF